MTQEALAQIPEVNAKEIDGFSYEETKTEYTRCLRVYQEMAIKYANLMIDRARFDSEMDNYRGRNLIQRLSTMTGDARTRTRA
jgi:hypothetical protein